MTLIAGEESGDAKPLDLDAIKRKAQERFKAHKK